MKVELYNIKKIKRMDFDIPNPGVWLLTGLNGSGKTSLLAALFRIGASHAFQKYYKTSRFERMDSFENSKVRYVLGSDNVTYKYGGKRWRSTPSKNSTLLNDFPFPHVYFIEANGDRVEPFADEIKPRSVRSASQYIKDFMVYVLGNQKWKSLKYVNTRRGVGSEAFLLPYQSHNITYYYSEKNFSLGELCALRLAHRLSTVDDNSMILIDEIEMALHPQAQVRLLEKISDIQCEKSLTVLFSTHSATLIKNIQRDNIMFLRELSQGRFDCVTGIYPAQALGEIAYDDELSMDFIFFVEDKQAKILLEQLIAMYHTIDSEERNFFPLYRVVPIGGFQQVLESLSSSSYIFPDFVRRYVFLDADVETESIPEAERSNNQGLLSLLEESRGRLNFLPCTPEQGLMELVEDEGVVGSINLLFPGSRLNISRMVNSVEYQQINHANIRKKAKKRVKHIVMKIKEQTGYDEVVIHKSLYQQYCSNKYVNSHGQLQQIFAPIFNAR